MCVFEVAFYIHDLRQQVVLFIVLNHVYIAHVCILLFSLRYMTVMRFACSSGPERLLQGFNVQQLPEVSDVLEGARLRQVSQV